jgi:hypothetical protein
MGDIRPDKCFRCVRCGQPIFTRDKMPAVIGLINNTDYNIGAILYQADIKNVKRIAIEGKCFEEGGQIYVAVAMKMPRAAELKPRIMAAAPRAEFI